MNLFIGFYLAWTNLMNLFDYDLPGLTGQIYQSGNL